ncbi:MAG: hypothetical protein JXB15_06700 [Anaerolineales bacterium]|nr:hypothetical protein [Anaerolineales bacterium]
MKVKDMFPSKFVKGDDLKGPTVVTIARVVAEEMYKPGVGQVTGYVLYTQEGKKGIVLSRVLAGQIAQALKTEETEEWSGKRITLYPHPLTVAGVPRVAIRARAAGDKA